MMEAGGYEMSTTRELVNEYADALHWTTRCPRRVTGGAEGHKAMYLTHRIIEGRICCMDLELAHQWDQCHGYWEVQGCE